MFQVYPQPDGGIVEIDSDVQKALTDGYAPLGWEGDPRLFLAWNRQTQRVELWRTNEDGRAHLIIQGRPGQKVVDMRLIQFLVQHDPQRGYDPAQAIITHNRKVRADAVAAERDRIGEASERLYHAFQKDIGHHLTGSRHDYQPLPEAPWKRDTDEE